MSYSYEYGLPVFIGTGSVLTSGGTDKLTAGQVGIFDAQTYQAAAGTADKRQGYIVAGGSWHKADKLNKFWGGVKGSDKSIEFLGDDILEFQRSYARSAQSEQWTLGWDGVSGDSLNFESGKSYNFRLRIWGEDVYGTFLRPIDRFIQVQADCADSQSGDCESGNCNEAIPDKKYAKQIVDIINNDPEFGYFVKAEVISSDMLPASATHYLWDLTIPDAGGAQDLAAIVNNYPGKAITRVSRLGNLSTYEFCDAISTGSPADFTPVNPIPLEVCGTCPSGYTPQAAADVYVVRRPVTPTTDLTSDGAKATYAATIVSAYSATSGSGKFLSVTGGVASVEISVAAGTSVSALAADKVVYTRTQPALCVPPANSPISWVNVGNRYKTSRTLQLILEKNCGSSNRLADLTAFYANNPEVVSGSLALLTTGSCNDIYQIQQYNNACLADNCLSNALPAFNTLQSFEGFTWTAIDTDAGDTNTAVKVGVRITAAYIDTKYGGCSFSPLDYYSVRPLKLEIYHFDDSGIACNTPIPSRKVRNSSMPTQSGEWVIRKFIDANKYKAYGNFYMDPRMREALDAQIHEVVDRNKTYKLYFLKVKQNRSKFNHQGDYSPEIFEMLFAFPQEVDTTTFEKTIEQVTSQFGVYLKDR